jgi:hypothetical protein
MKNYILLLITIIALVACNPTTTPSTPTVAPVASETPLPAATDTAEPVATTVLPTVEPTITEPTATVGATNTPAPIPPTFTPIPTDEAEPTDVTPTAVVDPAIIPPAAIIIAEPGNGSLVTSPVIVRGVSDPSFENAIVARLISADGTEIAIVPGQIAGEMGQRGEYEIAIDFEVSEITPAFIQVYTDNPMDGAITTLASVGIQLLPESEAGQEEIIENTDTQSHIVITSHANGDTITGGSITIEGFGRPTFESTFVVEMTDANGTLMAREAVTVNAPMGQYGYFSVTFPYTVTEENMPARVRVLDISPAHGDYAFVNSVLVRLNP